LGFDRGLTIGSVGALTDRVNANHLPSGDQLKFDGED
jgi:hypothetical protein